MADIFFKDNAMFSDEEILSLNEIFIADVLVDIKMRFVLNFF